MIEILALIAAVAGQDARADDLRGTAGVCVRWDGPKHVRDAVVVEPSGNPDLDASLPNTIKAMAWQRPEPPYNGGWVGVTIAVADSSVEIPLPKCDDYRSDKSADVLLAADEEVGSHR